MDENTPMCQCDILGPQGHREDPPGFWGEKKWATKKGLGINTAS